MRSGENKLLLFYTQSFTRIRDRKNERVEGSVFGDLARSQKFDIGRNVTNIDTRRNVVFTKVSHRKKNALFDL